MKIEYRKTKSPDIVQITTLDERWYRVTRQQKEHDAPSSTWLSSYYPKGIGFYKWLAAKGWDEAQAIKFAAGEKGSKVHQAVTLMLQGHELEMDAKIMHPDTNELEELSVEEWECLMSFKAFWQSLKMEFETVHVLAIDQVGYNEAYDYAGTLDLRLHLANENTAFNAIYDFKTGQHIWKDAELQINSYRNFPALGYEKDRMFICQLGYLKNKAGWKLTEIYDKFHLFLAAREMWKEENEGKTPKQKDYPQRLSIEV